MSGRKNFEELRKELRSKPGVPAKVEEYKKAMRDGLHLAELRRHRALTQETVAGSLKTSQPNVSRIESEHDLYLSTLRQYVSALGGQLQVTAVFSDDERVQLLG